MEIALLALSASSLAATVLVLVALVRQSSRLEADRELRALPRPADLTAFPLLSIVVPVRDEERNVVPLLRALLGLDYPRYEVLVVDDASRDRTLELARQAAGADPRVRLLRLEEAGDEERGAFKSGKAFALSRAASQARGEWLLFVDADTRLRPDAPWRALAFCRARALDAFSSAGVYRNPGFWGDLLEGTLFAPLFLTVPLAAVNDPARRDVGWANGQFLLVRRAVYEHLGGHGAVRAFWVEDLALGRLWKLRGVPCRYCPDGRLFECVNYVGWVEAHRGWARLVGSAAPWLAKGRGWFLRVAALLVLAGVLPLPLGALAWATPAGLAAAGPVSARGLALAAAALALFLQGAVRWSAGLPLWRTALLPLGALLTLGTLAAGYRVRYGAGFTWRGRALTVDDPALIRARYPSA